MKASRTRLLLLPTLAALLLIPTRSGLALPAPPEAPTPADSLTATVRVVDTRARALEVITGVGLALRLERFKVDPASEITHEGKKAALRDLKRGQVVRIQYRTTPEGKVAQAIETVEIPDEGGK